MSYESNTTMQLNFVNQDDTLSCNKNIYKGDYATEFSTVKVHFYYR